MFEQKRIPSSAVIRESVTTDEKYCCKNYIIYLDNKSSGKKIRVNTEYKSNGDTVLINKYYDRGLCDSVEELESMDLKARYMVPGWTEPDRRMIWN